MNEYGGADDEAARDPCFFHPRLADREVGAEEGGDAYGAEKSAAFRTKQTSSIYKHAPLSDNVTSHRHERRGTRVGRGPSAHPSPAPKGTDRTDHRRPCRTAQLDP